VSTNDPPAPKPPAETVLIVGGGMAGLSLALALDGSGKQVVIIERDLAPPELAPHEAFERWKRPGVSQFRYPHVFVGRLHGMLRNRYPKLFEELEQAGFRPSSVVEHLPPALREGYVPQPDDPEIAPLYGRRATFEYVLRRHVGRMPHVRFEHGAVAQGLVSEQAAGTLRIVGVEIKRGDARETLRGDVIVDAAGRNSPLRGWLQALGGAIDVQNEPSQFLYFCRHYRLRDGEPEPARQDVTADLDYLKYAIFYAERGHFAVAFGCAEHEPDLVEVLRRADGFDGMCRQLPGLAPWVNRAEPVTKVMGAAKIANRWSRIGTAPHVLGLFLIGDAGLEANPIYGRGCAAAFLQSQVLARALTTESDPARRAEKFEAGLRSELYPHFRASVWADQVFHSRANRARGQRINPLRRLQMYVYEKVIVPAVLADMFLAREILRAMGMNEAAGPIRVLHFVLRALSVRFTLRANAARLLPPGPGRGELIERVKSTHGAAAPDDASGLEAG
jgi:2-polyprenyl-6-methoxyphenol hydroxylase-like FAD-dependent oxidoreductase